MKSLFDVDGLMIGVDNCVSMEGFYFDDEEQNEVRQDEDQKQKPDR